MKNQTRHIGERGSALLAALMMLVIVSIVATFLAGKATATANDIQQRTNSQDEYWLAKSLAETVEASTRADLPTAYDLEMRLARAVTVNQPLPAFDPVDLGVTQSNPIYEPTAWRVEFDKETMISVTGERRSITGTPTSLFGNLPLWLEAHRRVPINYATYFYNYSESQLELGLNEAFRLTPTGGTGEPRYIIQFAVDATAGLGGRVRQTGLITLGPPIGAGGSDACGGLTASIKAAPTIVASGQSSTLTITFTGTTQIRVTAQPGGVIYDQATTEDVNPQTLTINTPSLTETTVFTLTASRKAGAAECSTQSQVSVVVCPTTTVSFTASPTLVAPGGRSTLTWNVPGATSVLITGPGVNFTGGASGSLPVTPTETSTYNLSATTLAECPGATGSVTVTVCCCAPTIQSFTAVPNNIPSGSTSTLNWTITDATDASISPTVGAVNPVNGSASVAPATTTTYNLSASNPCGQATAAVQVNVCTTGPTINSFTATPTTIAPGGSSTISWNVSGALSVSISQDIGAVAATGSVTVTPSVTTQYVLVATNACGQNTATLVVTVDEDGGGSGGGGNPPQTWCEAGGLQGARFSSAGGNGQAFIQGWISINIVNLPCGFPVRHVRLLPSPLPQLLVNVNGTPQRVGLVEADTQIDYATGRVSLLLKTDRTWAIPATFGNRLTLTGMIELRSDSSTCFAYYDLQSFPDNTSPCPN